jgi:hypothetical protein
LKLPTDDALNAQVCTILNLFGGTSNAFVPVLLNHCTCCLQIKSGFDEGKDMILAVMSAMGEEQICVVKEILGKN